MQSLYALKLTVSNYCLYRCNYCYVDTDNTEVLSEQKMYQAIDYYISQLGEEKTIFFLGGESLLEFDMVKRGVLRAKEKGIGKKIHLFITTSGLSLNSEKVDFLYKNGVKVGVSIDGNEKIHGLNRVSRTGKNTYFSTLSALTLLNKRYSEDSLGYAMTVDENTVHYTFKSFLFLSHLDKNHRNITIAGVYKNNWKQENLNILEREIEKICSFIFFEIAKGNFYFYNVLSFFILEIQKGNILKKGNIELHVFPDGQVSLYLFAQSILGNIGDDPTAKRFTFVNDFARAILYKAKDEKNYQLYIEHLLNRPIL